MTKIHFQKFRLCSPGTARLAAPPAPRPLQQHQHLQPRTTPQARPQAQLRARRQERFVLRGRRRGGGRDGQGQSGPGQWPGELRMNLAHPNISIVVHILVICFYEFCTKKVIMVKTFRVGLAEPNWAIEKFTNKNVIPKKRKMERNEKNKTVQIIKKKSIMATQSLKL